MKNVGHSRENSSCTGSPRRPSGPAPTLTLDLQGHSLSARRTSNGELTAKQTKLNERNMERENEGESLAEKKGNQHDGDDDVDELCKKLSQISDGLDKSLPPI